MNTLLRKARLSRSLTLKQVSATIETDPANLARIEIGKQTPKRKVARALYSFYDGQVPLGGIYDPEFYESTLRSTLELT